MSDADKIVHMANQIATFFKTGDAARAVAGTRDHIVKFWDPRMRARLVAIAESGGSGLDPVALQATRGLRVHADR
ncbi:MAG: formate dehydrogenase subunit delta [Alphaproteobacteria bacterium]|nr:formate dehydrogenase subunit delta [Alphaproteobacteria bacterium]